MNIFARSIYSDIRSEAKLTYLLQRRRQESCRKGCYGRAFLIIHLYESLLRGMKNASLRTNREEVIVLRIFALYANTVEASII